MLAGGGLSALRQIRLEPATLDLASAGQSTMNPTSAFLNSLPPKVASDRISTDSDSKLPYHPFILMLDFKHPNFNKTYICTITRRVSCAKLLCNGP